MSRVSEGLGGNSPLHDPRVTVVIPCHNHAGFLERSVASAVSQAYPNKKIIIVDDGSTDESLSVAHSLRDKSDGLVEVIHNESPTGPSAARNIAIKQSWENTDFYCMLDADDSYIEGKISKSVDIMAKDPYNIGMVYADVLLENFSDGTISLELRRPYDRKLLECNCIISNTPLINKLAFSQAGLYDESMRTAEDWDLWLRITEHFVAIHIPEPLSTYSITGFNASDTVDKSIWEANWEKIRQRIERQKFPNGTNI